MINLAKVEVGSINAFNTGRSYTAAGQRIAWVLIRCEGRQRAVAFVDVDRGIDGTVRLLTDPTNKAVLTAYDNNLYAEFQGDWTLKQALVEAARTL